MRTRGTHEGAVRDSDGLGASKATGVSKRTLARKGSECTFRDRLEMGRRGTRRRTSAPPKELTTELPAPDARPFPASSAKGAEPLQSSGVGAATNAMRSPAGALDDRAERRVRVVVPGVVDARMEASGAGGAGVVHLATAVSPLASARLVGELGSLGWRVRHEQPQIRRGREGKSDEGADDGDSARRRDRWMGVGRV